MKVSQVFSLCLSPPSLHRTTKASASGAKSFARSICSPGQDFAWLTHLCNTFLINVFFKAFKQVTHWLAERPPMPGAGFISSPVRGLTAAANLSCPFSFLFLTLSLCATMLPSSDPQGACWIAASGLSVNQSGVVDCTQTR